MLYGDRAPRPLRSDCRLLVVEPRERGDKGGEEVA